MASFNVRPNSNLCVVGLYFTIRMNFYILQYDKRNLFFTFVYFYNKSTSDDIKKWRKWAPYKRTRTIRISVLVLPFKTAQTIQWLNEFLVRLFYFLGAIIPSSWVCKTHNSSSKTCFTISHVTLKRKFCKRTPALIIRQNRTPSTST